MRNPKNTENYANDEAINKHKKFSKKGKIILITAIVLCAIIIGAVVGFLIFEKDGSLAKKSYSLKVYSVAEMLITLPEDFKAENKEGFTACFKNKNIEVETFRESFSSDEELTDYSVKEYAYIIKEDNMKKLKHTGELDYFEYTDSDKYYITAIYKTNEAFWTLTFSCNNSEQEEYKDTIIDFAKEVKFSNQTL